MNQQVWIKLAQALTMVAASLGIQVQEESATAIVTGAFGLLSVLSALKAWLSRNK